MKYNTLSIGGATYDLFVRLPSSTIGDPKNNTVFTLPLGAKIRVEDLVETAGGGAANTSTGFSRLGCKAHFEGVIGSDQWGEKLLSSLQEEHVETCCATVVEGETTSFSIILSGSNGERVILYEPGTNAHLHDATFNKDILKSMDWVYLNHIQEGSAVIQDDITEMLTACSSCRLTWNPGGNQIDKGLQPKNNRLLLENTDLLILNREEALAFAGQGDTSEAIRTFIHAGVSNVCVTDGGNGVIASDGSSLFYCPPLPDVSVVDTTGAGDAFGTTVSWALLQGISLPEALIYGSINGASVVSAIGAQTALLTDTEIKQRRSEYHLDVSTASL